MRLSLLYNPLVIIDRLAVAINRGKRLNRLKGTPAEGLGLGYIDSMELIELVKSEGAAVKYIFDGGANIGTWTLLAKSFFADAEVHAFEPLDVHIQKFGEHTRALTGVHLHAFCLGSENTTGVINVSSFSDSSSILTATPLEYQQFGIKKESEETVSIKRLDGLIRTGVLPVPDLMKLDVQGFELEILKGAGDYLNQIKYLIVEVSFRPYYYSQPLFPEIAAYLAEQNFLVHAFGHATPVGTPLGQIDVLFKRAE